MIVSASYRTDIPAFYGRWFLNRFRAGWAKVANPYYGRQVSTIPLRAGVDGFVFWTRNVGPFTEALAEIRRVGLPFVVQYTVTGYPRVLESAVVDAERSIALIRDLAATHGPRAVVWRYDPILVTSVTPVEWHSKKYFVLGAVMDRGAYSLDRPLTIVEAVARARGRRSAAWRPGRLPKKYCARNSAWRCSPTSSRCRKSSAR